MTSLKLTTPLVELLLATAAEDPLYQEMVKAFREGSKSASKSFTMEDDLLFVKADGMYQATRSLRTKS